jgi:hypothetical protein
VVAAAAAALEQAKKAKKDAEDARQTADASKTETHDATHTHKDYTATQIVAVAGYTGATSVHPYYGGRVIMTRAGGNVAGKPTHFTQFRANYDTKEYKGNTPIKTAVDEIFGGTGTQSFHVTQELHGERAPADNPHYYVTDQYRAGTALGGSTTASEPELKTALHNEIKRIYDSVATDRRLNP